MARWVAAHLGAGLIGAFAAYAAFFGIEAAINTIPGAILYLAGLLVLAAAPALTYQALALRHGIPPRRWIGFTLLSLVPTPALLLFGTYGLLDLISALLPLSVEESSRWFLTGLSGWVLTGFAVGLFWVAPMQWFAVRGAVPFPRWWLYGGLSLGLAAATVVAVFLCALIFGPVWLVLLPLAALIYAVGTYPVIRPLHQRSGLA